MKIKKTNYAAKSKLKVKNRASDQRGKVLNRLSSSYFEAETVVAAAALASTSLPTTPIHFAPKEHRGRVFCTEPIKNKIIKMGAIVVNYKSLKF